MPPSFWTFTILFVNTIHSHQNIRNKSRIICDGNHDSCIGSTILCPDGFDCEIMCIVPDIYIHNHSATGTVHCPSSTYGCCHTHIYCPFGKKCNIQCNGGCIQTHIHSTNSSHLEIKGCNKMSMTASLSSSCHAMSIYCPWYGPCEFQGDYTLQSSHIHTLRGFHDISLKDGLTLNSCRIYSGPTTTQYIHNISNKTHTKEWYLNKEISAYFDTENETQMISYITVGVLLLVPVLLIIIALIYHHTQTGSDPPEYLSVFKCFINSIDLYTDIIFCVFLLKQNSSLYIAAMVFTALPHIISVITCILYIHKWRDNIYKIAYIKRYDNLVITLTVLIGFVPTIELLYSKLFYASRLTLQICLNERVKIQQFRWINNNILQDIPLIIIQILTVFDSKQTLYTPITLITFCFSSLSAIIGTLTFIANVNCAHNDDATDHIMTYEFDIKSNRIESRHYYCHRLFAECLCYALQTNDGRIETVSVVPMVDGISCRIEIEYVHFNEINVLNGLFKEMTDNQSDTFRHLQNALCKLLHIDDCSDLNVCINKLEFKGMEGNVCVTKLKRYKTMYIPLKRRGTEGTNTMDLKREMMRFSKSDTGDVIEEDEDMPLKQQSLLLETMKRARVNTNDTLKSNVDAKNAVKYLDEKAINTQNAIMNGWNGTHWKDDDITSRNMQSDVLSHLERTVT